MCCEGERGGTALRRGRKSEREGDGREEREAVFLISKDGVDFDLIIRPWNAAAPSSKPLAPVF